MACLITAFFVDTKYSYIGIFHVYVSGRWFRPFRQDLPAQSKVDLRLTHLAGPDGEGVFVVGPAGQAGPAAGPTHRSGRLHSSSRVTKSFPRKYEDLSNDFETALRGATSSYLVLADHLVTGECCETK